MAKALSWTTDDKRIILLDDLGDIHLVNILRMIEINRVGAHTASGMLPEAHMKMYDVLVSQALVRGLFDWSFERKYLVETARQIDSRYGKQLHPRKIKR